jgi:hypothetical protein
VEMKILLTVSCTKEELFRCFLQFNFLKLTINIFQKTFMVMCTFFLKKIKNSHVHESRMDLCAYAVNVGRHLT